MAAPSVLVTGRTFCGCRFDGMASPSSQDFLLVAFGLNVLAYS